VSVPAEEIDLASLIERFGSEDRCRAYLEALRWPDGPICPRCERVSISRLVERHQYECNSCRYQFSVTAGTLFHDSHLPLWKWFLAIYLMAESKKGISAKQLQRMLKVSYKTAWYLAHRIRDAMGEDEQPLLQGIVEVDEKVELRFNRRANPYLFRDILLVLLHGDALPYRGLIEREDLDARRRQRDAATPPATLRS